MSDLWVDSQQDKHEEEHCRPTTTGDWQAVGVVWALIGQLVGVQNPHNITTGHTDRMIDLRTINLAPNSQADQPNMWVDSQQDQHEEEECCPQLWWFQVRHNLRVSNKRQARPC